MALPLPLRNRVARLILEALRAFEAREALGAVWRFCIEPESALAATALPAGFPLELFEQREGRLLLKGAYRRFSDELCERADRAWTLLRNRPFPPPEPSLETVLDEAADLFDAGLYFEVHELLESYWVRAQGSEQDILRGLIQVAVGFHHLWNGNLAGARSLLDEGSARLLGRALAGREVGSFAVAVRQVLDLIIRLGGQAVGAADWPGVPRFPREQ